MSQLLDGLAGALLPRVEEKLDRLYVTLARREMEGGNLAWLYALIDLGTRLEQQLDRLCVVCARGGMESGQFAWVCALLDLGAALEE